MIKKGTSQKSKCLKRNKSTCGLVEKGTSLAIEDGEELGAGEGAGVSAGGTEALEDAGTAAVFLRGDPLEVGHAVVGSDAVEVVNDIAVSRLGTNPCDCHGYMHKDIAVTGHAQVLLLAVSVETVGLGGVRLRFDQPQDTAVVRETPSVVRDIEGFAASPMKGQQSQFRTIGCEERWGEITSCLSHNCPAFAEQTASD